MPDGCGTPVSPPTSLIGFGVSRGYGETGAIDDDKEFVDTSGPVTRRSLEEHRSEHPSPTRVDSDSVLD